MDAPLWLTTEYVRNGIVIVHPSYEQLVEFCRRADIDARANPADRAFIESTGAQLAAWPSKWRWREYEWAGLYEDGVLAAICVYDLLRNGYVRVELDYTLQAFRGNGFASKLHLQLETLWRKVGMKRFKTKAGTLAGVRFQASMSRTFWGQTPGGELYVDHPLVRSAPDPRLPKDLRLFASPNELAEVLSQPRFGASSEAAALLARRMIVVAR